MLTRTLRIGMVGKDVEAHKRGAARALCGGRLAVLMAQLPLVRRTFGPFFQVTVKQVQKLAAIPQTGVIGPATHDVLLDHMDAKALALLAEYAESVRPKLIEPNQGFGSLRQSLWEAFSIGRRLGLSDLGTFNPASTLPSGGPSDHAVYPAAAFDLGIDPDTGWDNETARGYVVGIVGRPEIEYVILGSRIWTNDGRGWHAYTGGGHFNHVHVSGRR